MVPSIKEADIVAGEGTVGKQEVAIVGRARHRTVVGLRKRGEMAATIVGFGKAAKQHGVRRDVEVDRLGRRECRVFIGGRDGYGRNGRRLETILEVRCGKGGRANRVLLIARGGVIIVVVNITCAGGGRGFISVGGRGLLHDSAHSASGRSAGEGRATTSASRSEADVKLSVGVGDLCFELGMALSESLSDNVVHKTIAILKLVSRMVATQTNGRGILMLGDCASHEIEVRLIEGGLGIGREIRIRGLNPSDIGSWRTVRVGRLG
jgi:hypothetical protein